MRTCEASHLDARDDSGGGLGPSFRWFNPDAGALPLSRFVRQGGGFDFPFPEATRKNWHAPVHSRAHETTMRICPGV
jgi:hypothetical protein